MQSKISDDKQSKTTARNLLSSDTEENVADSRQQSTNATSSSDIEENMADSNGDTIYSDDLRCNTYLDSRGQFQGNKRNVDEVKLTRNGFAEHASTSEHVTTNESLREDLKQEALRKVLNVSIYEGPNVFQSPQKMLVHSILINEQMEPISQAESENYNKHIKNRGNTNGFFQQANTAEQNRNPNTIFFGSYDPYAHPPIQPSTKGTPEAGEIDDEMPTLAIKHITEEKRERNKCCAIF